jgi:hypothetical protein
MDGFTNQALAALNGTTLGLGVTYDRQAGYGGMLGIGGDRSNVNIAFSQRGDTTISGSANTSGGLQLTASSTTNGSTTLGANYNPSNEGPRRGSNYSLNYDLDNGRMSGSGGYTDTRTGIGFTTNVESTGLSLSTQYNGNNIATVSGNGFQYDEFNWAQNNINVAQNETGDTERAAKERETLLRRGIQADAIDAMTPSDRTELAAAYTRLDENASLLATDSYTQDAIDAMTPLQREAALNELNHAVTPDAIAASAMALLGSSAVAFGFMLGGKTNSNTPAGSSSAGQVANRSSLIKRREDEIIVSDDLYNRDNENNALDRISSGDSTAIGEVVPVKTESGNEMYRLSDGTLVHRRDFNEAVVRGALDPEQRRQFDHLLAEYDEAEMGMQVADEGNVIRSIDPESEKKLADAKKNLATFLGEHYTRIKDVVVRGVSTGIGFIKSVFDNETPIGQQQDASRPLDVKNISNSSVDLQQRFIDATEQPNLNNYKKGESLQLSFPEGTDPEKIHATLEKTGIQMIKDAYFDYDGSKSKDLLEKFAKDNGLTSPTATPEQKQLYQKLNSELTTVVANAKADLTKAKIDYTRENYARITTEKLVARYGDQIDTANSTDSVTVLKDGKGMILNQVAYDSQRDNTFNKWYTDEKGNKYNLRPGSECAPTSNAMVSEYMGAIPQNGLYQLVDDQITQAEKDGLIHHGKELQENPNLSKILAKYGQQMVHLPIDQQPIPGSNPVKYQNVPGSWKTESIKNALKEGKPVAVSGVFDVGDVNGPHRLVIVGYDSTGWIVQDPWGNANNTGYSGSGMYAHYDYGKWDIGKGANRAAYTIEAIPK